MSGPVTLRPASPPRATFGEASGVSLSAFEREAMGAFLGGREEAGLPGASCDPVLGDVAEAYARVSLRHGDRLAAAASEALLDWAGAIDPHPQYNVLDAQGASEQDLLDHARALGGRRDPSESGRTALGFGRASEGRHTVFVVVTSGRVCALSPLPRRWEPGRRVELRGRLNPGFSQPELLFLPPGGEVRQAAELTLEPDGRLRGAFSLPAVSGEVVVELLAVGPRGPTVAALLTLAVGIDPLAELVVEPPPDEPEGGGTEPAARRMLALVNGARAARSLPALAWDDRLAAAALSHAEACAARGVLAHVGADGSTPGDRVRAAGVAAARVSENLARNRSLTDAHADLMRSLGHRQNILDRAVTHAGVAAVQAGEGDAGDLVLVCVFARPVGRVVLRRDREVLRRRLNDRRGAAGLAPLSADPLLDALAQAAAERVLAARSVAAQGVAAGVEEALAGQARRWSGWSLQSFLVALPLEETLDSGLARDARATHLGVGLAQGSLEDVRTAVVQLAAVARR